MVAKMDLEFKAKLGYIVKLSGKQTKKQKRNSGIHLCPILEVSGETRELMRVQGGFLSSSPWPCPRGQQRKLLYNL